MKRAVRTVLRLIAAALILFGGMGVGLEYTRHRLRHAEVSPWQMVLGLALIALGVALFTASGSLAERLTDDLEE